MIFDLLVTLTYDLSFDLEEKKMSRDPEIFIDTRDLWAYLV